MDTLWLLVLISCVAVYTITGLPEYHQKDYDVKFERAELIWYNHSYARDVKVTFPFFNRSQRVLNASGYLLFDQTSFNAVAEVQVYKFMSNECRFFPITVAANLCEEYAHNNFNVQGILRNKSNLHGCPLKKGFYYIHNVWPDFSKFPPFIPRGRYKAELKVYYNKEFAAEGHAFVEVVDKPIEWWKL